MIYYFSGTGNSEWVAKTIASLTSDEVFFIPKFLKDKKEIRIKKGEVFGLIFPIYAWRTPKIVLEFLNYVKIEEGAYCFAVCTCGDEAGYAMKLLDKKMHFNAMWSVIMPNNYIVMFDVDSNELAKHKVKEAKLRIEKISEAVNAKRYEFDVFEGSMPKYRSTVIGELFNKTSMSDKPFYSEDTCIGCGTCVKVCPLENIELKKGRPVWLGHCQKCMACIHRCPVQALQHGSSTKKRGRYYFSEDLLK